MVTLEIFRSTWGLLMLSTCCPEPENASNYCCYCSCTEYLSYQLKGTGTDVQRKKLGHTDPTAKYPGSRTVSTSEHLVILFRYYLQMKKYYGTCQTTDI